jgi:hypothetical protein
MKTGQAFTKGSVGSHDPNIAQFVSPHKSATRAAKRLLKKKPKKKNRKL